MAGPRQHSQKTTDWIMLQVLLSLLPGIACATYFFGYGLLLNIMLAMLFACGLEAAILRLRGFPPGQGLRDYSVLVTAVLFALTIPPGSPWWLIAMGICFAVLIAKHAFGGLGQNPFNPAMCGYLFLLIAFPIDMTTWHIPNDQIVNDPLLVAQGFSPLGWNGFQQSVLAVFPFLIGESSILVPDIDGLAMATPLLEFKMATKSAVLTALNTDTALFDRSSGTGWELINIGFCGGGIYLLLRRIISWHIPASILVTVGLLSTLFYAPNSFAIYGTPYLHLLGSATMLGAFFIATDPVSAATTSRGKLWYGIVIGCSIYSIRVWGSYLDSVAIAVLFGNFCAPLLDHFNQPRIYGHRKSAWLLPAREKHK